jgi:DNA-directed RNA polymerase subunit RPC12/RpoP
MKCLKCEAIYPDRYTKCPSCGSKAMGKQKYGHKNNRQKEDDSQFKVQDISVLVENSEISAGEFRTF